MRQLLLAPLIALSIAAFAEDVVLEDGRRMTIDREMVVVPNADARVAMFIVHLIDGSKTVESIGVSGCLSVSGYWRMDLPPTRPCELAGRLTASARSI